jgi:modulator of FtsH protease HflC
MSGGKTAVIVAVLAVLIGIFSSTFIVDERQQVLVQRFGEVQRVVTQPGLYFKLPFADEVVSIEDRAFIWSSENKTVQVSDRKRYLVDTVTTVRISDARKFRETVGANLDLARARIETRLDAALRQTYGKRTFAAALSKDRNVMMREIRDQVEPEAASLGVKIIDVRIRRTDLANEVLAATYERMKSERLAEAQDLRSKGEAQNIQMKATADRKAIVVVSDATRQSEVIRGEGDGDRSRIFADAFSRDPGFFSFYRSMQAYGRSFNSSDTSLVLKPDSEFFQYFGNDQGRAPAAAPVPAPAAPQP